MPSAKRALPESAPGPKAKKSKTTTDAGKPTAHPVSTLTAEDVDFPRGGGSSLTPLEVKSLRVEAVREADAELFQDAQKPKKTQSVKKKKSQALRESGESGNAKSSKLRIEHLNYKRMYIGQKIFGQVVSIQPLALVISLPNQLFGHVPITQISSQYTAALEKLDQSDEESEAGEEEEESQVPSLADIFAVGQYVRAVVTAVNVAGTTSEHSGLSRSRDDTVRASRRVELSLTPEKLNEGVQEADLKQGFTITGSVKAVEDHGYTIDLGVTGVAGFLSFKDAQKGKLSTSAKYTVGQLLDLNVAKFKSRICNLNLESLSTASIADVSNSASVLPGALVQALVTEVRSDGLATQILGFFEGTVDEFQLPKDHTYKLGSKIKARIIYTLASSPPKFALSLSEQVLRLRSPAGPQSSLSVEEEHPLGSVIQGAKIVRCEPERGLVLDVSNGRQGFVHISHVSDDHTPVLSPSSGHWKIGTLHKARVTGYFAFDGLLQLSLKHSVNEQRIFQASDVQVGEVIKGTIKRLTPTGLFVALSDNVDGLVKPLHFADITLKNPGKKFKEGAILKCKVLNMQVEQNRVLLTCKKSLLESTLPIISSFEGVAPGVISHGVVAKVLEKQVIVSFYNGLKAFIPHRELSETPLASASEQFTEGRVVKVKILSVDAEQQRMIGSIRQTSSLAKPEAVDVSNVEIGDSVQAVVKALHKDNALLSLQPSHVQALISLKNISNFRDVPLVQLRSQLQAEDILEELVVVSRNPEKGIVIVAHKPRSKQTLLSKGSISIDTAEIGQTVMGRVTRHTAAGALVKLTSQVAGILHLTDVADDYSASGTQLPTVGTVIKAVVVAIEKERNRLVLSTRPSRMAADKHESVVDSEVASISDITEGQTLRGLVKKVADHGLFVTIGRNIDGRVQIRELFDEYVKDWQPRFKADQVVKARILKVDKEKNQVELTMRSDAARQSTALRLSDLSEGQIVDGVVKRIEPYGLFIQIADSTVTGLCHKSELSDSADSDVDAALSNFRVNDSVKAFVLTIKEKKLNFSLKPSLLGDALMTEADEEDSVASEDEALGIEDAMDLDDVAGDEEESSSEVEDEDVAMNVDVEAPTFVQGPSSKKQSKAQPCLPLTNGFGWFDPQQPDADLAASDASDEDNGATQKSKKKKKGKEIEYDLTADMHTKSPDSVADFERVLLGSPDSSYVWIQYMSFQIQLFEIDKARSIARRALNTINFREELEKMNVWIALLNLENAYGTDESLDATFKEAARSNDSKTIHLRMAAIFEQSGKTEKCVEQYTKTCKKFGHSSKAWTVFAEYHFKQGDAEAARQLLPRSLQSLEKRKHLKTISKFAQLEYKLGDAERGRTIYEGIVDSHKKRWDMWSIYVDMEATQGEIQSVRNLMQRILSNKLSSYKAKSFFKKWMALEQRLGDAEGEELVKQKAIEWTSANTQVEE